MSNNNNNNKSLMQVRLLVETMCIFYLLSVKQISSCHSRSQQHNTLTLIDSVVKR